MTKIKSENGYVSEIKVQKFYENTDTGTVTVEFINIVDRYKQSLKSDSMEPLILQPNAFAETVEMWESMFALSDGNDFELSIKGLQEDVDTLTSLIEQACARYPVEQSEL